MWSHSFLFGDFSLQNRGDFLRISGEQGRRRGKCEANAKRELRARGGSLKNPACRHTIVQAVPAFKYERSYLIGYFKTRDPRMFFQDVTNLVPRASFPLTSGRKTRALGATIMKEQRK